MGAWLCGLCSLPLAFKVDILPAEVRGMLVQPSVFKTDVGREKRLGGVRFPCISAMVSLMDGESHPPGSTLLVFHRIRNPPSVRPFRERARSYPCISAMVSLRPVQVDSARQFESMIVATRFGECLRA